MTGSMNKLSNPASLLCEVDKIVIFGSLVACTIALSNGNFEDDYVAKKQVVEWSSLVVSKRAAR